ncbi:hypothetical protein KKF86_00745, partial [bacterium]|nr:hypothetical protein [bacterium]
MRDYYKYFASYYSEFYTYKTDLPFWTYAAKNYAKEGAILYVGPGTGRIMGELLLNNQIVAVEKSSAMVRELSMRLGKIDTSSHIKKYEIYNMDINDFSQNIRVPLIILPCNVLTENRTEKKIVQMLNKCSLFLDAGGYLAIDVDNATIYPQKKILTAEKEIESSIFKGIRKTWARYKPEEQKILVDIKLIKTGEKKACYTFTIEYFAFT